MGGIDKILPDGGTPSPPRKTLGEFSIDIVYSHRLY